MHQSDPAEQIEQLHRRLVDAGRRGDDNIGVAMDFHVGSRRLERHQVLAIGNLAADRGCNQERAAQAIDPRVMRVDHPQLARFAHVDRRKGQPHTLPQRREARPHRNQQQQGHADRRQ